jgi:hypothetical protein
MKVIPLPAVFSDQRIDTILELFNTVKHEKNIMVDFTRTHAVSPAGYAILTCFYDTIIEQQTIIHVRKLKRKLRRLPIIEKIVNRKNVLTDPDTLNFESENILVSCNGKTLNPLFTEKLIKKFAYAFNEDLRFDVQLIINELMQNTVDHSSAERYYMYGGIWYNEFHVGVLDMGVTLPAKLEQKYVAENDIHYLELALKKGISTRRLREGGFGLYFFYNFLKKNNAKLTMVSRDAQIRLYFQTRKSQKSLLKYRLNGTWCFARFDLTNKQIKKIEL